MLPNFVVIGAQKSGTSSLWEYLRSHPQVFMSADKEPQYFAVHRNWDRGQEWYESLFQNAGTAKAVGEASTVYSKYPVHNRVPERMAQVIPEARLIYLVRHPIERIRSHYEHLLRLNSESRSLASAVLGDPKFVNYSRYALQIDEYREWFSMNRLLVVTSESLRDDRASTLRRIFEFLGVEASWVPPGIDIEHGPTRSQQRRSFARRLQRMRGYRRIARAVPNVVKPLYRKVASRSTYSWLPPDQAPVKDPALRGRASMPPHVREELKTRLADDAARLREFLGPQFDGWGIA